MPIEGTASDLTDILVYRLGMSEYLLESTLLISPYLNA